MNSFSVICFTITIVFGMDQIIINPSVKINYILNKDSPISTFEWKKWGGHHGLSEPNDDQVNTLLNLGAFSNRWLKPESGYFTRIPPIKGSNIPDLSWFNDKKNQELVLNSFPTYLQQFGAKYDLIYCVEGCTWPYYMVNSTTNASCDDSAQRNIPYNLSAAASLIIESLKVIQKNTSQLPRYFEPQNEPWTGKFGKDMTAQNRIDFQNYVNYQVYKNFGDKIIVGGPAMDGESWFKTQGNSGTVFSEYFEYMIKNAAKSPTNYSLDFISWHHFSSFTITNTTKGYVPNFWGSGAVSATMDLIESYTNSMNGYKGTTKILVSEHGYSAEADEGSGLFNISYMQYIAVTTYITDTMLFLERPESQYKIDAFYLDGNYAINNNYPVVLINASNDLTPTGNMYNFNKLLRANGGNIVEVNVYQGPYDRIKVHSLYNNKTNKLLVVIKDIAWMASNINLTIVGYDGGNKSVSGLSIFWDSSDGKFIYRNVTVNLNEIYLESGETLILNDISYTNDNAQTTMVCRRRYYSNNFSTKPQKSNVTDTIIINEYGDYYKGIVRVGLSWNMQKGGTDATKLRPQTVVINGNKLDIEKGLNRVDNLVQNPKGMSWAAFEYPTKESDLVTNGENKVEIFFGYTLPSAVVTSVVAEIYTMC